MNHEAFAAACRHEDDPDVQLYRETKREIGPKLKARHARALAAAKKTCDEADARAHELRHRGRPKSAKRLPPMQIQRNPDALLVSVPQWQGER